MERRSDALVGNQCHIPDDAPVAADLRVGRSVETHPGPLRTEFIREAFHQLLSGLAAAHQAGLIHRDIKSSNILLDEPRPSARADVRHHKAELGRGEQPSPSATGKEQPALRSDGSLPMPPDAAAGGSSSPKVAPDVPAGRSTSAFSTQYAVKIADFGLARMLSARTRMTMTGSVLGTPEYMSPEQARGDEHLDHRTDLYSAGVVLYEMLTGRTPFKAETPSAVIHRILHDDPPDPRTMSKDADPHLASLALRLMAKRPDDRFVSAADAITALGAHERVRFPERRRKIGRQLITGVAVLGLALVAVWSVKHFALSYPPIADTRLDPSTTAPRTVEVQYGDDSTWRPFYEFPPGQQGYFLDTAVVDADGKGRQIIVVGARKPLDDAGSTRIAFERSGEELWRKPVRSEWQWPDVQGGQDYWHVQHVLAGELDGVSGDELIVVAQDQDYYPACISLIEPFSGESLSSYWHFGHIEALEMIPGYFEHGRPAIMAWGYNNKLAGFADESADGSEPLAHWDDVSVLMILDPMEMDGVGPPPTDRLPVAGGNPYAYAFLDRPRHRDALDVTVLAGTRRATRVASLAPHETSYIESVVIESRNVQDGTGPWLRVNTMYSREPEPAGSHRPLIVDRNLNLRQMAPIPRHLQNERATKEYWEQYWQPIIQDGDYVGD